jgi:hypothetical protein
MMIMISIINMIIIAIIIAIIIGIWFSLLLSLVLRMTAALLMQPRWFSSKSPSWSSVGHGYQ